MLLEDLTKSRKSQYCLTLVGVGPGDPSLLTLAGCKAIQEATVVSYPVKKAGDKSIAASIASQWITQEKKHLPLVFPMTKDSLQLRNAWREAANELEKIVKKGEKVVFLSEGDVSLFSTSSYLILELKSNHSGIHVELIPGVNSFSAAAAIASWPLTLQDEQLLVIPTPDDPTLMRKILLEAKKEKKVIVLLKLGRKWSWLKPLLEELDLLKGSLFAQKVGFPDQKVINGDEIEGIEMPYFSLLLIRQSWPEILPNNQLRSN